MEGYQNYQEVINAIKAEYVNARNLKKNANTKKREAKTSASFKTRKENEKTSLETKLTSVENSLEFNLSNSINNLEDAKFDLLKTKVSELKGKLAFIDADILKLEDQYLADPNNIGYFPRATKTPIEAQTLTVLRNMLSVTIDDAESVINNIYDGQDYYAIKSATIPTQLTHTQEEVKNYYYYLRNVFGDLFDKVKSELDDFVISIFYAGVAVNSIKNQLISNSQELVNLKSDLATLLENQAPESEITAKEQQIEDLKLMMLSKATDLKEIEVSIGSAMTTDKLLKLKRYSFDLNKLADELRDYRLENASFLIHDFADPTIDIAYRSFQLYSGFFDFMDSNTPSVFDNGFKSEFKIVKDQIIQAKENLRASRQQRDKLQEDIYDITHLDRIFNCNSRNNGNGTEYFDITDFKPEASKETKEFYVNYSLELHNATSNYIQEKIKHDFNKNSIGQYIGYFNGLVDTHIEYANSIKAAKLDYFNLESLRTKKAYGWQHGTPEKESELSTVWADRYESMADYVKKVNIRDIKTAQFIMFNAIFPEFYNILSEYENNTSVLNASYESAWSEYNTMWGMVDAAYDYLQTLTAGEADYVAALADYEAKITQYNDAYNYWQSTYTPPKRDAYNTLQSFLPGENSYQDAYPFESYTTTEITGAMDGSFINGSGFNGDVYKLIIQPDGKMIVGGNFTTYNGIQADSIIRLNSDRSIDESFYSGSKIFSGFVMDIELQSDGKILVSGSFAGYDGELSKNIVRLNSDGTRDSSFNVGSGFNQMVRSTAIQSDDKILVAGWFTSYNGALARYMVRLNSDGTIDNTFNIGSGFNESVFKLILQPNGKILVSGAFTSYNGTSTNRMVRLNSDGTIDNTFDIGSGFGGGFPSVMELQSDGKILVSGYFNTYNGNSYGRIIRLNTNGTIDTSFSMDLTVNNLPYNYHITSNGKILFVTNNALYQGIFVKGLFMLNSDGTRDTSFDGSGIDGGAYSIVIQDDGSIIVAGDFIICQGVSVGRIAKFGYTVSFSQFQIDALTDNHNQYLNAQIVYDYRLGEYDSYFNTAVSPAETMMDTAYTALLDLSDEDAAYQNALRDWNNNTINKESLWTLQLDAQNALESAESSKLNFLASTFGENLNLSYTGYELRSFKEDKEYAENQTQLAQDFTLTTSNAIDSFDYNGMTYVDATPIEKREAIEIEFNMHKAYKQVTRIESLLSDHLNYASVISSWTGQFAWEVRNHDETYFAGLLQNVKDFMDGNNLFSSKYRDMKSAEWESNKYDAKLSTFLAPTILHWDMEFGFGNGNIAITEDNSIQRLSTDSGIDGLKQKIANINNDLFRNVDGFNFADRIFNEVNNGTPLI